MPGQQGQQMVADGGTPPVGGGDSVEVHDGQHVWLPLTLELDEPGAELTMDAQPGQRVGGSGAYEDTEGRVHDDIESGGQGGQVAGDEPMTDPSAQQGGY